MCGSDAVRAADLHSSSPEDRVISRRVVKAFEAWDPSFGMLVIMNSGAVLRMIRIVLIETSARDCRRSSAQWNSSLVGLAIMPDSTDCGRIRPRKICRPGMERTHHEGRDSHPSRFVVLVALAVVFAVSGLGTDKKVRVFNSRYEAVWSAATEVAKDAFLPDRASKEEGKLRFRAGPFRGYRFEVFIVDAGSGKTRVELELRTNLRGIEKDAWRNGDRYLALLAQKLQRGSRK